MNYINENRYVFTKVKSGISDFKRFSGSFLFYLFRNTYGELYVKRFDGEVDEEVEIKKDPFGLNRYSVSENFSLCDDSSGNVYVSNIGLNPYKFSSPKYDSCYYSYLESGTWKTIGYESILSGVSPSFAVIVATQSGDMFFVFQEGDNVSIYQIGSTSITKKSEIENFYLIDAKAYNNDIMLFVSKIGTRYPSELVEESFAGVTYEYFLNSPSVFICSQSSLYAEFYPFCMSRSVFPVFCKSGRKENSFFLIDGTVYVISLAFTSSVNGFVPIVAMGEHNDSWRRPVSALPFGYVTGVESVYISVDSNEVMFASCKKGNDYYLTYYSRSCNSWKPYDQSQILSFEDSQISSSSSSSSSSSE